MAVGKKRKEQKGEPCWTVDFNTNHGHWPVSMHAPNRRDAAKKARAWLRKAYPDTKIIKLARVVRAV